MAQLRSLAAGSASRQHSLLVAGLLLHVRNLGWLLDRGCLPLRALGSLGCSQFSLQGHGRFDLSLQAADLVFAIRVELMLLRLQLIEVAGAAVHSDRDDRDDASSPPYDRTSTNDKLCVFRRG